MAIQRYIKAIQYTAKLFDLSPQDKAEADALKLACNLNLAQAYIRLSSSPAGPGEKSSSSASLSSTQETFLKKAVSCCDAALETEYVLVEELQTMKAKGGRSMTKRWCNRGGKRLLEERKKDRDFLMWREEKNAVIDGWMGERKSQASLGLGGWEVLFETTACTRIQLFEER